MKDREDCQQRQHLFENFVETAYSMAIARGEFSMEGGCLLVMYLVTFGLLVIRFRHGCERGVAFVTRTSVRFNFLSASKETRE